MRTLVLVCCCLCLASLLPDRSAAQERSPVHTPVYPMLSTAGSAPPPASSATARLQADLDMQLHSREAGSWLRRHPVLGGALIGSALGLAGYVLYARNDPYCRDPDMFPCELAIPIYVAGGASIGALVGYIVRPARADGIR